MVSFELDHEGHEEHEGGKGCALRAGIANASHSCAGEEATEGAEGTENGMRV
jgi:hypothetical protein